jgi:hypothetical protein
MKENSEVLHLFRQLRNLSQTKPNPDMVSPTPQDTRLFLDLYKGRPPGYMYWRSKKVFTDKTPPLHTEAVAVDSVPHKPHKETRNPHEKRTAVMVSATMFLSASLPYIIARLDHYYEVHPEASLTQDILSLFTSFSY